MFLLPRLVRDVDLKGFHFVDEALLLKAEEKMEYVVSC